MYYDSLLLLLSFFKNLRPLVLLCLISGSEYNIKKVLKKSFSPVYRMISYFSTSDSSLGMGKYVQLILYCWSNQTVQIH